MSKIIDDVQALRIIKMLLTPFESTRAYKLGIIDKNGNNLIKSYDLKTQEQKEAYTKLDVLVFNLKKLINRLPGGESTTKNVISAYLLLKESMDTGVDLICEKNLLDIQDDIKYQDKFKFFEEIAANNASGGGVSGLNSDDVAVNTKKKNKNMEILSRFKGRVK